MKCCPSVRHNDNVTSPGNCASLPVFLLSPQCPPLFKKECNKCLQVPLLYNKLHLLPSSLAILPKIHNRAFAGQTLWPLPFVYVNVCCQVMNNLDLPLHLINVGLSTDWQKHPSDSEQRSFSVMAALAPKLRFCCINTVDIHHN